jgi:Ca-activated chloride channel family protein
MPTSLVASMLRHRQRRERVWRIGWLAIAASLLLIVGASYWAAGPASRLFSDGLGHVAQNPPNTPIRVVLPDEHPQSGLDNSWGQEQVVQSHGLRSQVTGPTVDAPRAEQDTVASGLADPHWLEPPVHNDSWLDVRPYTYEARNSLAIHNFDELPELYKAEGLAPRGIDWPIERGSNRAFLLQYRVHPFVSPAAHPRLQTTMVPLGVDVGSYELTRRYIQGGRVSELPPPEVVRPEEFLAAMDYGFPAPTQQPLEVSTAAGPSPFAAEGFSLLQVGVQARQLVGAEHPPVHVVFVVDTSASMRWGGRGDVVRRALKDFVRHLQPADRVSLIAFSESARVLVQELGPGEASQLLAAVESLSSEGSTNVAAGLSEAETLVRQATSPGGPSVRVVLLTDGLIELEAEAARRTEQRLAALAARNVPVQVINLGQEEQCGPQLAALAEAGRGAVRRATNVDQVRWALREIVTGVSELVARDAQLKVTFNPKAVLEYRLMGHEAKVMTSLLPEHPQADFHDGQSATALYELRLAPKGPNDVGTVELTWYTPGDGTSRGGQTRIVRTIERKDFAPAFSASAASLQEAALVAQTAEILRRSPFVHEPRSARALHSVLELSGQADSRLRQRSSFVEFLALVDQAIKARPAHATRRP